MDYSTRYGSWALVLGGSEGLGGAIADELARRRMNVALVARRAPLLQARAASIESAFGVKTKTIVADMATPDVVATLERGMDGEDVAFLVYNCAAEHGGQFFQLDLDAHINNLEVNCIAPTKIVHHFGRKMIARAKGGIVLCSSLAGEQGIYNWVSYGGAKAYEKILGEGLWYEGKLHGVDATTFMVGSTYTPNFQRQQQARKSIFADSRTPANLPAGVPIPQDPAEAAANLFAQTDKEWLPRIYANPLDEQNARTMARQGLTPADMVNRISDAMRIGWETLASA